MTGHLLPGDLPSPARSAGGAILVLAAFLHRLKICHAGTLDLEESLGISSGPPASLVRWGHSWEPSPRSAHSAAALPSGGESAGDKAASAGRGWLPAGARCEGAEAQFAYALQLVVALGVVCAAVALSVLAKQLRGAHQKPGARTRPTAKFAAFPTSVLLYAKQQPHERAASDCRDASNMAEACRDAVGVDRAVPEKIKQDPFRVALLRAALGILRRRNLEAAYHTAASEALAGQAAPAASARPPSPKGGEASTTPTSRSPRSRSP